MKNTKKIGIGIIAIIAITALIFTLSQMGATPYTIVSLSQVDFQQQGTKWVGTLAVNQPYEEFEFVSSDPAITIDKQVKLSFRQLQPQCNYAVFQQSQNISGALGWIPLSKIEYLTVGGATLDTPYNIAVYRDGVADDTARIELEKSCGDKLCTTGSIQGPTTLSLVGGKVKLNQLGNLTKGISCPDGANIILLWIPSDTATGGGGAGSSGHYSMVDKSAFYAWQNEWTEAMSRIPIDYQKILILYNTWGTRAQQMTPTGGFLNQVTRTNVNQIGYSPTNGSLAFIADMQKNVSSALVQFEISADYAVTYVSAQPKPTIINVEMVPTTLTQAGQRAELKVTVKNEGTGGPGRIEIHPYSLNGILSFAPVSAAEDFAIGETKTVTFLVYALNPGTYQVQVRASGLGSGLSSNAYISGTVQDNPAAPEIIPGPVTPPEPPPIVPAKCGDGTCEGMENFLLCPLDCPIVTTPGAVNTDKEECLSRQGDGIFIQRYNWTNAQALGLIAGTCEPVYNWPLAIIIALLACATIGGIYAWKKYK